MPDKGNPLVPVTLGRRRRHLKYTLGAVLKFRELTGLDIYKDGLKLLDLDAVQFRALIYCGLLHEDEGLHLGKVSRKIGKKNIIEMVTAATLAVDLSLPEREKDKSISDAEVQPPDWLELSSFGRYCLKVSEREFWGLTMAQFVALAKCYQAEQERQDYRTAVIASHILNTIPRTKNTKHKVFYPWDIFPQYGWKKKPELTEKQLMDKIDAVMFAHGGGVKNR